MKEGPFLFLVEIEWALFFLTISDAFEMVRVFI